LEATTEVVQVIISVKLGGKEAKQSWLPSPHFFYFCSALFWGRQFLEGENLDLKNTISENAMQLMFELNGWTLTQPFTHKGIAFVKPDFYPDRFVIGTSKKGYIYACGHSRITYRGRVFDSVKELIDINGNSAIDNFKEWLFEVEKEWVITRNGQDFIFSFTTLDQLPNRKKVRC